jgi:uncharacterized protein DUF87
VSDNPFADLLASFNASVKESWEAAQRPENISTQRIRSRPSFWKPFLTWRDQEARELKKLYRETRAVFVASPFATEDLRDQTVQKIILGACKELNCELNRPLLRALFTLVEELLIYEFFTFANYDEHDWANEFDMEMAQDLSSYLDRMRYFQANTDRCFEFGCQKISNTIVGLMQRLPSQLLVRSGDGQQPTNMHFDLYLIELIERPIATIEDILLSFLPQDLRDARLFEYMRKDMEQNIYAASGLNPDNEKDLAKPVTLPTETKGKSPIELVELYLTGTPFEAFFTSIQPLVIPDQSRFEHCHILGGTGHGKSQCLQYLIHEDLVRAVEEKMSIVVIDSQGDLVRNITSNRLFEPHVEQSLASRFILIDPSDIENPPALNLFDPGLNRMEDYSPYQKELAFNSLVDIYGRFFGALLGADLTARQNTVFRYLARLMLTVKGATIHTMIELMDDLAPFQKYIKELDPTARRFFEKEFASNSFRATRQQIKQRLYAVLSIPTFDRLFSAPKSKINFFDALNDGKIILINTAKDLLKQDGTAIFGRFVLALIEHAIMERAILAEEDRTPVFLYIDEAQDYFDDTVETLLVQARKYRCGLTLAHQTLAQLSPRLKAIFMSNTTIKLAGGVSDSDARALAADMRTTPEFLLSMKKRQDYSEFALSVRNLTTEALQIDIALGYLENSPVLKHDEHATLLQQNQLRIAYDPDIEDAEIIEPKAVIPVAPPAESTSVEVPENSKSHRELQTSIKAAAQTLGFAASIEETVLDGKGRIDVAIEAPQARIAVEISLTTRADHEQQNAEKCFAAGYDEVWLVAPDLEHRQLLHEELSQSLSQDVFKQTLFFSEQDALVRLQQLAPRQPTQTSQFLGYTVASVPVPLPEGKASAQHDRLMRALTDAEKAGGTS